MPEPLLLVHGGAGRLGPRPLPAERDAGARRGLAAALLAGHRVLASGGPALEAVVRAVEALEDDPHFNAGRGSVLTSRGDVEMDASVMDGRSRAAGAVAAVRGLAHPVAAARLVMERSGHVLLVGAGAEDFARACGLESVDPASQVLPGRRRQLAGVRTGTALDHDDGETVGAVALDAAGHTAAATSTGGVVNQLPGRVGDSPIVGAGTWADDRWGAISATGTGEIFLRCAFAHEVVAQRRLAGLELEAACAVALEQMAALGGRGGCIALDAAGRFCLPCRGASMFRGVAGADGLPRVALHADEEPSPPG